MDKSNPVVGKCRWIEKIYDIITFFHVMFVFSPVIYMASRIVFLQLMNECWDDSPINRPDFESVKKTIHRINPHKMSPVDLMMAMVSKTSTSIMNNGGNN